MECYYHPDREGSDVCAICGKSICKECGLEIAGKVYCKECLEKIVGLSIDNQPKNTENVAPQEPVETEPAVVEQIDDNIYQPQEEYNLEGYSQEDLTYNQEPLYENNVKAISDDSPYNIKDNISGDLESSYLYENENNYAQQVERQPIQQPPQNELTQREQVIPQQSEGDFIYPDHSYQPELTSARQELEDKYERYLDDLYFDENEVPLGEQLAKDEAQYGSLTKKSYEPIVADERPQVKEPGTQRAPRNETPEEMEARIRAELAREYGASTKKGSIKENAGIHNLNYKEEKEPMGTVDIILTIILIIVILIVVYYLIYLFLLHSSYPTFLDAVYGLTNPQNVINNVLNH